MAMKYRQKPAAIRLLGDAAEEFMKDRVADALLTRVQRLVPKRTYSLHDSLESEVERISDGEVIVRVGVNENFTGAGGERPADYAPHVENGTSKAPAQPYLRPALAQTVGGLR